MRIAINEFLGNYLRGRISASGIRAAATALAEKYPQLTIIDAHSEPCSITQLRRVCKEARRGDEHTLLVVDSLHALASGAFPDRDEYPAVSATMEDLRAIAVDQKIAILAVIERNRASMTSGGISAGAASRKIEYAAEAIIELAQVGEGQVNLRFAKNRNGRAGVTIGFIFDGARQRFTEVGDPWGEQSSHPRPSPQSRAFQPAAVAPPPAYEDRDLFG